MAPLNGTRDGPGPWNGTSSRSPSPSESKEMNGILRLPVELRDMIYAYLDSPLRTTVIVDRPVKNVHQRLIWSRDAGFSKMIAHILFPQDQVPEQLRPVFLDFQNKWSSCRDFMSEDWFALACTLAFDLIEEATQRSALNDVWKELLPNVGSILRVDSHLRRDFLRYISLHVHHTFEIAGKARDLGLMSHLDSGLRKLDLTHLSTATINIRRGRSVWDIASSSSSAKRIILSAPNLLHLRLMWDFKDRAGITPLRNQVWTLANCDSIKSLRSVVWLIPADEKRMEDFYYKCTWAWVGKRRQRQLWIYEGHPDDESKADPRHCAQCTRCQRCRRCYRDMNPSVCTEAEWATLGRSRRGCLNEAEWATLGRSRRGCLNEAEWSLSSTALWQGPML